MSKKVIIAGGGTGGHIFPAIAIANALKELQPDMEILFVGAKGKMEMEKVPQAGYNIEGLDIVGFDRSSLTKNMALPWKLLKSFWQVRGIMSDFRPDAVVGVGGYSSFPVLKYAQRKGIYNFIHESNSFAGRSNRILGRHATRIFVALEGMDKFFPKEKIIITGNPVRSGIAHSTLTREEGLRFFNLDPHKRTVLSIGGSQGARSINEAIAEHINAFSENELQLIWQTGKPYAEKGRIAAVGNSNIRASEFIREMEYALAAADVVISRAGAMSVAELCVQKKPVVFVPFPFAAEDHQTVNAQVLVNKQAALMVRDSDAMKELVPLIVKLAQDDELQEKLRGNIGELAYVDADKRVAREIMEVIENRTAT